jgi:hypothetical protein
MTSASRDEDYVSWLSQYLHETEIEALSPKVFDRLKREWHEQKATDLTEDLLDIPYRALMSWALRQIADPSARRKEVNRFFNNLRANMSK